ncbi:MAG: DNA repair protein RecO [Firmicutes bacterium]|nr:DNA repair protein RecO [Bacillota bacterium]
MKENTFRLTGVAIRSRDYKDGDKIITIFSLEQGKITALAKGARKPTASLRGAVQLLAQGSYLLARSRSSLPIVTQACQEQSFLPPQGGFRQIAYASYVAELSDLALEEGQPSPELYRQLLIALSWIKLGERPEAAVRYYELQILREIGAFPDLTLCRGCGKATPFAAVLSPAAGGLLCPDCAEGDGPALSRGAVLTLARLAALPAQRLASLEWSRDTGREMGEALAAYLDYHLECHPKSRAFLDLPTP